MLIRNFHIPKGEALDRLCSQACFITGAVFLVISLLGTWYHLCTMCVCIAAGLLIREDKSH